MPFNEITKSILVRKSRGRLIKVGIYEIDKMKKVSFKCYFTQKRNSISLKDKLYKGREY